MLIRIVNVNRLILCHRNSVNLQCFISVATTSSLNKINFPTTKHDANDFTTFQLFRKNNLFLKLEIEIFLSRWRMASSVDANIDFRNKFGVLNVEK